MNKVYIADSRIHGQGIFAAITIHPGEPILSIDDSRIVTDDNPLRPHHGEHRRYCDFVAGETVVHLCPPECYINHSCNPNAFVRTVHGVRYVFALKPIYMTEEITCDYSINSRGDPIWQCDCGSSRCRRSVSSDFFHLPYVRQLEYLPLLDLWFVEEHREKVERLLHKALR